jgi:hypothetical protein
MNTKDISNDTYMYKQFLTELDSDRMLNCFRRPICTETIFILQTYLNSSSSKEIDCILELFGVYLKSIEESREMKSQETLASLGVYFSLILRKHPNLNIYIRGEHLLIRALKAYYPYMALYLIHFLIPAVFEGVDLSKPFTTSTVSNIKKYNSINTTDAENYLRNSVGSPMKLDVMNIDSSGNSFSDGVVIVTVINKIIDICPLNSPERRALQELRRNQGGDPEYIMIRLGMVGKDSQELGIFLDNPNLIIDLDENDIYKAIFMHSNQVLAAHRSIFKSRHFDIAVCCLNYWAVNEFYGVSDCVSEKTLDDLFFYSKVLKHAYCFEILKLVVTKHIYLCQCRIKKLPNHWKDPILKLYTTPRWQTIKSRKQPGRNATLDYYRMCLSSNKNEQEFIEELQNLSERLVDDKNKELFIEKVKTTNRIYYQTQCESYLDFIDDTQIIYGNDEDIMFNDIFSIPRNFVFSYMEASRIYLFTYQSLSSLIEAKKNMYNRNTLKSDFLAYIKDVVDQYSMLGIPCNIPTIEELIDEIINGRELLTRCECNSKKSYAKKLTRLLRQYNVREEYLDVVNIRALMFNLSLMSFNLKADTPEELWTKVYHSIKTTSPDQKESIKKAVASLILSNSRASGAYLIGI